MLWQNKIIINIEYFLRFKIFDSNGFDFDSTISYKQWVSTDRTTLVTLESTVNEFIDTSTDKIFEVCHHHFMEVQQTAYLKEAKAMLDSKTCIILMDFAENYSFLVQHTIQSFYWQNQQNTFHPFAVYHNDDDGRLKYDSSCVISDYLLSTAWSDCSSLFYLISNTNNSHKKPQNQQD